MAKTISSLMNSNPQKSNESTGAYEARISGLYRAQKASNTGTNNTANNSNTTWSQTTPTAERLEAARNAYNEGLQASGNVTQVQNGLYTDNNDPSTYYALRGQTPEFYGGLAGSTNDPNALSQINTAAATATQQPIDPYAQLMAQMKAQQEALAAAQRQSRISGLGKARDNALSGLDAEKATIDPYYYDKRNQAAGQSDVSALNFAQYMAGRGIKGAAGAMPEIYRNAGLQGQIGSLDQQQAAEVSDIERRRSGVQSAYESDVASANADIDAQTMQAYIDTMRTVEAQRVADKAAQGLTSTGEQTLQGQSFEDSRQRDLEEAYRANIGRFYDNYQAEINNIQDDGDPTNDWQIAYLQAARQQKIQAQAEQAAAAAAAASEADMAQYEQAFNLWKQLGYVPNQQMADILGVPVGAETASFNIDNIKAQTGIYSAETGRMNAETSRYNATKPSSSGGGSSGSGGSSSSSSSSSGTATERYNQSFGEDYSALKVMPVKEAISTLNKNWGALISAYGVDGAKDLWNTVLADAIELGQAKAK